MSVGLIAGYVSFSCNVLPCRRLDQTFASMRSSTLRGIIGHTVPEETSGGQIGHNIFDLIISVFFLLCIILIVDELTDDRRASIDVKTTRNLTHARLVHVVRERPGDGRYFSLIEVILLRTACLMGMRPALIAWLNPAGGNTHDGLRRVSASEPPPI